MIESNIKDTSQIKKYNRQLILYAFRTKEQASKNDIAKITGLSVATCNTLLNELAIGGEIKESAEVCTVGRPAKLYELNTNYTYICCIYPMLEAEKKVLSYAIYNLGKEIVEEKACEMDYIDHNIIRDLIIELKKAYHNIKAVSIGIPGVVTRNGDSELCDIEELSYMPLKEYLEEEVALPVIVDNDMNLTAYGAYYENRCKKEDTFAFLAFFKDICPGAGIIVNGKIVRGMTNFAGEISYLPLGYARKEQIAMQKDNEKSIAFMSDIISTCTAVLNPQCIMLTGKLVSVKITDDILEKCKEIIPQKHLPKLIYVENMEDIYRSGLYICAIEGMEHKMIK